MGKGRSNFDKELQLKLSREQYHANKRKAGMSSSTAGQPRPYGRRTIRHAYICSPRHIGHHFTLKATRTFSKFVAGELYTMSPAGDGIFITGGLPLNKDEVLNNFIIIPKKRLCGK